MADAAGDEEGTKRVRDALDFVLKAPLQAFVAANMQVRRGADWRRWASRAAGHEASAPLDAYALLKTILDNWREVFEGCFDRKTGHKARRLVSTVFDARNATAHLDVPLSDAEALHYLFAMVELAALIKAPEDAQGKLRAAYEAQRQAGLAAPPAPADRSGAAAGTRQQSLDVTPEVRPELTARLRPWTEVAFPHPDVIANRFRQSEFAADLAAVEAGLASDSYGSPVEFFGITYLTEGLKRVLTGALERLAGTGGEPVIGLQTAFGGGKTHTMLAIYHLAQHLRAGRDPKELPGLEQLPAAAGPWPSPKIAVFVGSAKGPDVPFTSGNAPDIRTLWGYLAWRLAGERGLALVRDAEAARTNPGSERLVKLFELSGPCVILLDEVVMYARQLENERFEAFLSFLQSLTEAAKMAPGVLVVGSLPESDAEAGGEKGREALKRLEKVFGRVQSAWTPASGDETYEIIRRRLFQPLDGEGEKARDETAKAFHDLYRKAETEFPAGARSPRYLELLKLAYPIHPELFDILSRDWSSLEKFQRTRGVLKLMANVIATLWQQEVKDPLITPARLPVAAERVRTGLLLPLDNAFAAVVDKEVDGVRSLPAELERNTTRRISQARAATRVARAVFMATAPLAGQPNFGVAKDRIRLACAEPGDQLSVFSEALQDLAEKASFFYDEAGRYWFSTRPTLNTEAEARAKSFEDHVVEAAILRMLGEDAKLKGGFHRVFPAPDDPTMIDEVDGVSLVILHPTAPHAPGGESKALGAVTEALTRCRTQLRRSRNMLLFVAADEAKLETLRIVTRKALAWESVAADQELQKQLTVAQIADAKDKARQFREAAVKALRDTWSHIIHPVKSETDGKPFDLSTTRATARDRKEIPIFVYDRARADGLVKEEIGPESLWLAIKDLWPADRPHLQLNELWEWCVSYAYMPRLQDRVVLEDAVRKSVASLDPKFAYAAGFDEEAGRYRGLVLSKYPPESVSPDALLVRIEAARTQVGADMPIVVDPGRTGSTSRHDGHDAPHAPVPPPKRPTRFYGSVELDLTRPVRAFEQVLNNVIQELQRAPGTKVTVTIEIEAVAEGGFAEDDASVVRDNAKALKFKDDATGFE